MRRLIDADKLYQSFLDLQGKLKNRCIDIDDIYHVIKDADTVDLNKVGGWISVTDRLPEKYGIYICTIDVYDRDRIVDFVAYDPNLGWYVHNVIAWMPKPEPPEP